MLGRIGPQEILILLAIILLIFGPSKLPQLAKSIGESVNELREGMKKKPEEKNEANSVEEISSEAEPPARDEQ